MEKKFKLKKDGQPLSMPCTKEQWEAIRHELDEIEGVSYEDVADNSLDEGPILINNFCGHFGIIANVDFTRTENHDRTHLPTHDKEAFLSSLRGEPIVKEEVKKPVTFNDEYWEKLYHECAMKIWISEQCATPSDAAKVSKMLIEELKNNPLK